MARTLDEIRASRPKIDHAKVRATTEADIRHHMIEDDSEPAGPLSDFVKRRPGQRGPGKRPAKVLLTMRIEPAILEAWKATGEGWQTRIHDLLKREAPKA